MLEMWLEQEKQLVMQSILSNTVHAEQKNEVFVPLSHYFYEQVCFILCTCTVKKTASQQTIMLDFKYFKFDFSLMKKETFICNIFVRGVKAATW